ncbi:YciI family protein [Inquilinus sp. CAU 1745]|uniref:YciI family protein n=1 Tax=Inquilinus sp. CAU 1745 TaxID=3140369 RepID=UPI00325AAD0C
MQFLVIARDGEDPDALDRRLKVREAHLAGARKLAAEGRMVEGGAILDDDGKMVGSAVIVDFPDRAALDDWLRNDPYVTGDVWRKIDIMPFRIAPLRDMT